MIMKSIEISVQDFKIIYKKKKLEWTPFLSILYFETIQVESMNKFEVIYTNYDRLFRQYKLILNEYYLS